MVAKRATEKKRNSMWIAVIYGVGVSIFISILGCMLGAILLNRELIDEPTMIVSMLIWIVSSFSGTLLASKLTNGNKLSAVGITAAVYLFILIGISILFFEESFQALWQGSVGVLIGTGLSLLICGRNGSKGRSKVRYHK